MLRPQISGVGMIGGGRGVFGRRMESARQNAISGDRCHGADKIVLDMPRMWHVCTDERGLMPKYVSRDPNEIFCRADSMRRPYSSRT